MSVNWKSVVDPFVMLVCSEKKVIITDPEDPYGHILIYQIRGIDTCMSSLTNGLKLCNEQTLRTILGIDPNGIEKGSQCVDAGRLEKALLKIGYESDEDTSSTMVGNKNTQTLFIKLTKADDFVTSIDELIQTLKKVLHDSSKLTTTNAEEFFEASDVKKFKDFL